MRKVSPGIGDVTAFSTGCEPRLSLAMNLHRRHLSESQVKSVGKFNDDVSAVFQGWASRLVQP